MKSGVLTLPDTLTSIGEYAVLGCGSLTSVTIPDGVISLGVGAFQDCTGFTGVTIPGSVTSIGSGAFFNCSNLTTVIFGAGSNITTAWSNNTFSSNSSSSGDSLWAAYITGSKAGTYTRSDSIWTQTE
jgi:hypothetical protein